MKGVLCLENASVSARPPLDEAPAADTDRYCVTVRLSAKCAALTKHTSYTFSAERPEDQVLAVPSKLKMYRMSLLVRPKKCHALWLADCFCPQQAEWAMYLLKAAVSRTQLLVSAAKDGRFACLCCVSASAMGQ